MVDDDQESRDLLSEVLNANGYSVEVAEDGEGLWKALDRKSTRLNSSHYSRSRMPSSA